MEKEEEVGIKHANFMFVFLDVIIIVNALFPPIRKQKIFTVLVLEQNNRDKQIIYRTVFI
jgi:hypothetical protein